MSLPSLPEKPKHQDYGVGLDALHLHRKAERRYLIDCARVWRELAMEAMRLANESCSCLGLGTCHRCVKLDDFEAHIAGITPRDAKGFCEYCGASIPHRSGEGRCPKCVHHRPAEEPIPPWEKKP